MLDAILNHNTLDKSLKDIICKIIDNNRISEKEGLLLYNTAPISLLGYLANNIRERKNGNNTYFNKNIGISFDLI